MNYHFRKHIATGRISFIATLFDNNNNKEEYQRYRSVGMLITGEDNDRNKLGLSRAKISTK